VSAPPESELEHPNAVCAGCGCLCDDIGLRVRGPTVAGAERSCPTGREWLLARGPLEPAARVDGKAVPVEKALTAAEARLRAAGASVVLGLHELTVEAIAEAVLLASTLHAPLLPWPPLPSGLLRSGHHAPECTATLGEVRGTADLVVFWRADPVRTHPRHLERYSGDPKLVSGGSRRVVLAAADHGGAGGTREGVHLPLPGAAHGAELDLDVIRWIRCLLEKGQVPAGSRSPTLNAATRLRDELSKSRHAHFFLGEGCSESPALLEELQLLAAKIRPTTRITVSALPPAGNSRGVVEALTWLTGSPGSALRPNWLLESAATDLVLALGAPPAALARSRLGLAAGRPRVTLGTELDAEAAVSIRIPGLDPRLDATVLRSDGIALTLCGRTGPRGARDPAVDLLRRLTRAVSPQRAGSKTPASLPGAKA